MPGLYLPALLVSAGGILTLDLRLRLVAPRAPLATVVAVAVGTAFFLVWDAAGILTGVFVKGGSALLLGIDLAPHLPLEEPVFLAFLSYLALVSYAGALRVMQRRRERTT